MWGGTINKEYIVYKATNKINGKIYVGKTYNFEKRKKEHIYDIDNDIPFHRALKKYGIDNFEWEIIDTGIDDKEIIEKEIYWIKKLNSCIHFQNSNGYNITLGGDGGTSWNSRPVLQFDLSGNYINEYMSCAHASAETGVNAHCISHCANRKAERAGQFQWRFKDECKESKIAPYKKADSCRKRSIIQLDQSGKYISTFSSITEASIKTGLCRSNISSCLTQKSHRCGGFQWIYKEDYDSRKDYSFKGIQAGNGIVQLNDNWEIINYFPNCSEAARYLGEPTKVHKQIHKALKLNKRCRGFYWRKYDDYMRTQQGNTEVTA